VAPPHTSWRRLNVKPDPLAVFQEPASKEKKGGEGIWRGEGRR